MAANFTWPASLPQLPLLDSYGESHGLRVKATPMDKGAPKRRRLGRRANPVTATYLMTTAQVDLLDALIEVTLRGVRRFNWPHPRLLQAVEAKIIADESGEYFRLVPSSPTMWIVSLNLEICP